MEFEITNYSQALQVTQYIIGLIACYFVGYKFGHVSRFIHGFGKVV